MNSLRAQKKTKNQKNSYALLYLILYFPPKAIKIS